jgi:predicted transcriptional regulator
MAFDLAAHVRRTRAELGLTQTELAKRAGIHQGDLSRIERGECDPRWSTVQRLSAALGDIVGPTALTTTEATVSPDSRAAMRRSKGRLRTDLPRIPVKR